MWQVKLCRNNPRKNCLNMHNTHNNQPSMAIGNCFRRLRNERIKFSLLSFLIPWTAPPNFWNAGNRWKLRIHSSILELLTINAFIVLQDETMYRYISGLCRPISECCRVFYFAQLAPTSISYSLKWRVYIMHFDPALTTQIAFPYYGLLRPTPYVVEARKPRSQCHTRSRTK